MRIIILLLFLIVSQSVFAIESTTVKVFLIAPADNGQSGMPVDFECNGAHDSLVAVDKIIEAGAPQELPKKAVDALLGIKKQIYGESGLYNAFFLSELSVDKVVENAGVTEFYIKGSLQTMTKCDEDRLRAQLKATALQFKTIKEAKFYINGQALDSQLQP